VRFAQYAVGTKPLGLETSCAGFNAVFLRLPIGGNHDAVAAPAATHPNWTPLQFGIERDFTTGEKGISIYMQNAIVAGAHR
jgi:hypothetical protein